MEPALEQIIESLIFVSEKPIRADFLLETLTGKTRTENKEESAATQKEGGNPDIAPDIAQLTADQVKEVLEALVEKYKGDAYPFEIRKIANGYQYFTKERYYPYLRKAAIQRNRKRLTRTTLETLAIVAYRQPIAKAEIEFIRGVNCDYAVQKLLEKQLVVIAGRSEGPGRPLLYATSDFFMQYFGISDVADLPKLKEFEDTAEQHMDLFRQHQEEKETGESPQSGADETQEKSEADTLLGEERQEGQEGIDRIEAQISAEEEE